MATTNASHKNTSRSTADKNELEKNDAANVPELTKNTSKSSTTLFLITLLVISFIGGLLLSTWYFQSHVLNKIEQKNNNLKSQGGGKILVVGTDATAPPMEYFNNKGTITGFDVDLGSYIGNELGYKVTFQNINWEVIFKQLEEKKIDMIISSVTINDERKKKYNFSQSYINAGQVIVSRKTSPIKTTNDLRGKKISVQRGTTNEKEALQFTSPNLVLSFDNFPDAAKAVASGKADATISDLTLAKGFVDQYENLKITSDPFTNEYYGIVFRKDEEDLLEQVNQALTTLQVKGVLSDLKQKWLD